MIQPNRDSFRGLQRDALDWLMRITSGDATVGELRQFEAWRAQSAAHGEAYRSALGIWQSMEEASRQTPADRISANTPSSCAFATRRRMLLGGGLAATAATASVLMVRPPLGLWPSLADLLADYHTATGEQRRIAVTEQVSAELNTRTAIGRRVTAQGEAIELIAGEVAISSICSADHPFTVLAGGGQTRSARAKFDIRYDGGKVRVTCLEGVVQIKKSGAGTTLQANQQVSYSDQTLSAVRTVDPTIVTAWQHGLLVFRDEELSQVVAEVNRYWPGRIVVTARIELARIGEVISYVRTVLGAKVRTLPGGVVLVT
jgi:transmembrane sensor